MLLFGAVVYVGVPTMERLLDISKAHYYQLSQVRKARLLLWSSIFVTFVAPKCLIIGFTISQFFQVLK